MFLQHGRLPIAVSGKHRKGVLGKKDECVYAGAQPASAVFPDVQTHTQVAFPFGKMDGNNSLAHSGTHPWHIRDIRTHSGTFGTHSMFSQPCLHAAVCENTQFSTVAAHTGSTFNATDLSFYKIKMVQRWGSTVRSTHFFIDLYLPVAVMPF